MTVDPHRSLMPRWLPAFNLRVTNRIQGRWAPYVPPWAMIVHTGRKSGRRYETPIVAFKSGDEISIGLPYGSGAQWVKNILAAGSAELVRGGKRYQLRNPRIVTDAAAGTVSRTTAAISRRMGVLVCTLVAPQDAESALARADAQHAATSDVDRSQPVGTASGDHGSD